MQPTASSGRQGCPTLRRLLHAPDTTTDATAGLPGWRLATKLAPLLDSPGNLPDSHLMKTAVLPKKSRSAKPRYQRLEARVPADLKRLIQDAADMRGVTLSDFIINSAHDAALETAERHNVIRLNREASIRFANALLRPARTIPRLRKAIQQHARAGASK